MSSSTGSPAVIEAPGASTPSDAGGTARPMRVLMLALEYPPHIVGGLGSHVGDLVPALDALGVLVTMVAPRWSGGPEVERLPGGSVVYRVNTPPAAGGSFLEDVERANRDLHAAALDVLQTEGPADVIHAHDWLVAFAAIALKHLGKTPLVATIHATERGRTGGGLYSDLNVAINGNEWWLCYEAWRVVTTTRYMAGQVIDYFHVPADKLDIVPNGVDRHRFDQIPDRDAPEMRDFRRRFAADDEAIVFHVGRLVGEKGAPLIVEAAPAVLAQAPKTKFVIAGRGPLAGELAARAAALGVAQRFYFTGFIPDDERDRLFRIADVAVFPSLYEPFGIVALEAMAARTPVVVSRAGGLPEVVEHASTGIHAYTDDPGSLAWAILHTLAHPDWTAARVAAAYDQVETTFDWGRIAGLTRAIYARVIQARQGADW